MRFFYLFLYYCFARHLPSLSMPFGCISNKLRQQICRKIFKKMGFNVSIKKGSYFGSGLNITIGNNSQIGENARIANNTIIGSNVMMGLEVLILSVRHAYEDKSVAPIHQGYLKCLPVVIGDDVWIGARAILLPGVRIGKGAVIGAGAVVTKNIGQDEVGGGVPARTLHHKGR